MEGYIIVMGRPWTGNHWMLRTGAALSLMVWLVGSLVCGSQCRVRAQACLLPGIQENRSEAVPACHRHSKESNDAGSSQGSCCCSQTLITGSVDKIVISRADWAATLLIPPTPALETGGINRFAAGSQRPFQTPKWVLTPVLCLGPAIRSHAPPSLPPAV